MSEYVEELQNYVKVLESTLCEVNRSIDAVRRQKGKFESSVERIRALHSDSHGLCRHCDTEWPCVTILELDKTCA